MNKIVFSLIALMLLMSCSNKDRISNMEENFRQYMSKARNIKEVEIIAIDSLYSSEANIAMLKEFIGIRDSLLNVYAEYEKLNSSKMGDKRFNALCEADSKILGLWRKDSFIDEKIKADSSHLDLDDIKTLSDSTIFEYRFIYQISKDTKLDTIYCITDSNGNNVSFHNKRMYVNEIDRKSIKTIMSYMDEVMTEIELLFDACDTKKKLQSILELL